MSQVVDVAPCGDLVIAIGTGTDQKVAKVSTALLRIASSVFDKLLSPNYKEGNTTYDASNPLPFPEDEPTSMINLCQILHWKSDEVDTTAADWLQKLTVACDKYKCAPKMSDFFLVKMAEKPPCAIDEFIMSSVIKHRLRLSELSDTVLRIPRAEIQATGHAQLLQLLPTDLLEDMEDYRRQARVEHLAVAQQPILSMFSVAAGSIGNSLGLCVGLQKRLAFYQKILVDGGIVCSDIDKDVKLPDFKELLTEKIPTSVIIGSDNDIDQRKCPPRSFGCGLCTWSSRKAILDAVAKLEVGTKGCCDLCFDCFMDGKFELSRACTEHNGPATKVDEKSK
ncbi:hypothetical protein PMZ80_007625 [Knufia obscura]|uniref:BTB domain-containing protein n=1 Tax=Knufia obscura TaxID=1635080 RepID=A0ABR0RIV1_9EURO|nr:hypothetical protein PMZ80_007625 [Knufia obscura]